MDTFLQEIEPEGGLCPNPERPKGGFQMLPDLPEHSVADHSFSYTYGRSRCRSEQVRPKSRGWVYCDILAPSGLAWRMALHHESTLRHMCCANLIVSVPTIQLPTPMLSRTASDFLPRRHRAFATQMLCPVEGFWVVLNQAQPWTGVRVRRLC